MFINLYVRFTRGQHAGEVMPMVRRAEMMLSAHGEIKTGKSPLCNDS